MVAAGEMRLIAGNQLASIIITIICSIQSALTVLPMSAALCIMMQQPQCQTSCPGLQQHQQCNSGQLTLRQQTQQLSYSRTYPCPKHPSSIDLSSSSSSSSSESSSLSRSSSSKSSSSLSSQPAMRQGSLGCMKTNV